MKMPPGEIIHFLLKTFSEKLLQQTKASCLQLGRAVGTMDQIRLLPLGEQQKGAKTAAATCQGRGHGQRTSQEFF